MRLDMDKMNEINKELMRTDLPEACTEILDAYLLSDKWHGFTTKLDCIIRVMDAIFLRLISTFIV